MFAESGYRLHLQNPKVYLIGDKGELSSLSFGYEQYTIGETPQQDWLILKENVPYEP